MADAWHVADKDLLEFRNGRVMDNRKNVYDRERLLDREGGQLWRALVLIPYLLGQGISTKLQGSKGVGHHRRDSRSFRSSPSRLTIVIRD